MRTPSPRGAAAVALSLLLVACTAATPPSASPASTTPQPTASPSPTPTVAPVTAEQVLARMVTQMKSYRATLTGSLEVGGETLVITGEESTRGADSVSTLTFTGPKSRQTQERLTVDGESYTRNDPNGPWFVAPAAEDGDLGEVLAALSRLEDRGTEVRSGRTLRRFTTPAGSLSPAALNVTQPGVRDFSAALDILANDRADVEVMAVRASWRQPGADGVLVATTMSLEMVMTGTPSTIEAPDWPWTTFTSRRQGYAIGYPADWGYVEGKNAQDGDVFSGDGEFIVVLRERLPSGMKLSGYVKAVDTNTRAVWGKPSTNTAVTIAGNSARRLTYTATINGTKHFVVVGVMTKGRYGYSIIVATPPGYEEDTLAVFEMLIRTFQITSG